MLLGNDKVMKGSIQHKTSISQSHWIQDKKYQQIQEKIIIKYICIIYYWLVYIYILYSLFWSVPRNRPGWPRATAQHSETYGTGVTENGGLKENWINVDTWNNDFCHVGIKMGQLMLNIYIIPGT